MVMEEQQSTMELASEQVPVPQIRKSVKVSRTKTANKSSNVPRGKPRFRKKALHATILKQMEFYFSDANLSKDRFLSALVTKNPYVDLNIFVKFNKIRELTNSPERIAKAVQGSTMLALSEDGTKVRRITPVIKKDNTDECTIYVQNLEPDTDHDTLITIFSQYGKVAYVSVPRYKSNKKIKGFAFVEFDTPEEAKKCLQCFHSKGYVLPSHTSPNELLSITTFDDTEKDITLMGRPTWEENGQQKSQNSYDKSNTEVSKSVDTDSKDRENKEKNIYQDGEIIKAEESQKKSKHPKKRKYEEINCNEGNSTNKCKVEVVQSKRKKQKHSEDTCEEAVKNDRNEFKENQQEEEGMQKDSLLVENLQVLEDQGGEDHAIGEETDLINQEQDTGEEKKKRRKRPRRSKMEDINCSMGLQIMAKKDWKYLRNKYLELQRTKMKQLKQHLKKASWNQWSNYEKNKAEKEETEDREKERALPENTSIRSFPFTSGVIVKVELNQPCTDPKGFKMELKGNNTIKYIDIEEGSSYAFLRCDTPETAQALIQKSADERRMTILQDKEEKLYWDKILQDRANKLSKKVKVKQRGRDKLLKKAEKELGKHIKFDEV